MSFICQLIVLFTSFLFGSSLITIGNYSELNPKGCGFSRLSSQVDTKCFEWHKNNVSPLKRGRNVGYGDAPWVVMLDIYKKVNNNVTLFGCTGAIIANQWILTAAHCLSDGFFNIKIYPGYNFTSDNPRKHHYYESNETYIHPKYKNSYGYDMALIKMNKPISSEEVSICLPEKWPGIQIDSYEYVMIAGWGGPSKRLKIAPWSLDHFRDEDPKYESNTLVTIVDDQGACKGDSGAPVWNYYMGRAVIVAVLMDVEVDPKTWCQKDNPVGNDKYAGAIWVDISIDWIKNITNLN